MAASRPEINTDKSSQQEQFTLLVKTTIEKIRQLSVDLPEADNWRVRKFDETPVARAFVSKEDVLKVEHRVKSWSYNAQSPKTERIHVDNYHSEISIIKINEFVRDAGEFVSLPNYAITLIKKNGEREYYFVRNEEFTELLTQLTFCASELNLAEFSLLKPMVLKQSELVYRPEGWDSPWENPETHGLYYDRVSDPMVLQEYVKRALPLSAKCEKGQPFTVLDIGAGKGRLAYKIISETLARSVPVHYILVEPSKAQLAIACTRLAEFSQNKNCQITFVNSTLEEIGLSEKAHCIVSSGGPLNVMVVSREQAIANVKRMQALLLPRGIVIATGQTALLVKAKHFEQEKLKVLSYATPCPIPRGLEKHDFIKKSTIVAGFFGHYQRYVCQKAEEIGYARKACHY